MDYKKVLRLHFLNHLSCPENVVSCGDCNKTSVNEFLKSFRECQELSSPCRQVSPTNTLSVCFIKSPVCQPCSSSTEISIRRLSTSLCPTRERP